jgi:glutaredoxin 3
MATRVVTYETPHCPYCRRARALLEAKRVPAEIVDVTGDLERRAWLREVTGQRTVPQIFINGQSIGGSDGLCALEARGKLDDLLAGKPDADR